MINKSLRILIADTNFERRFYIEKSLNRLGYYCVLPVETFEDLIVLSDLCDTRFDVLIANKSLTFNSGISLGSFCRATPAISHSLLYRDINMEIVSDLAEPVTSFSPAPATPKKWLLNDFMRMIDPRIPFKTQLPIPSLQVSLERLCP